MKLQYTNMNRFYDMVDYLLITGVYFETMITVSKHGLRFYIY